MKKPFEDTLMILQLQIGIAPLLSAKIVAKEFVQMI